MFTMEYPYLGTSLSGALFDVFELAEWHEMAPVAITKSNSHFREIICCIVGDSMAKDKEAGAKIITSRAPFEYSACGTLHPHVVD